MKRVSSRTLWSTLAFGEDGWASERVSVSVLKARAALVSKSTSPKLGDPFRICVAEI